MLQGRRPRSRRRPWRTAGCRSEAGRGHCDPGPEKAALVGGSGSLAGPWHLGASGDRVVRSRRAWGAQGGCRARTARRDRCSRERGFRMPLHRIKQRVYSGFTLSLSGVLDATGGTRRLDEQEPRAQPHQSGRWEVCASWREGAPLRRGGSSLSCSAWTWHNCPPSQASRVGGQTGHLLHCRTPTA